MSNTIEEIIIKKSKIENDISNIILGFYQDTGLIIRDIDIKLETMRRLGEETDTLVSLYTKASINI